MSCPAQHPAQRPSLKARLEARVLDWEQRGLGRGTSGENSLESGQAGSPLSFVSNDYLGLACDARWQQRVAQAFARHAPSASASRLAGGHSALARQAEEAFASYFGHAECLFFPSGYQGNLALVAGLVQKGQPVLVDKRIHASMAHALASSGAELLAYAHADFAHLERRLRALPADCLQPLVCTESLFSMDGTLTDVAALAALKQQYGFFLVVDEAHALGALGPGGRGVFAPCPGQEPVADVVLGTLGKALGFFGAFALLPAGFTRLLEHLSSPVMHSTAPAPAHAAACLALLELLPQLEQEREQLAGRAAFLRHCLQEQGLPVLGQAHIVSVPVGDAARTLWLGEALRKAGVLALAARWPTVPHNRALLRFGVTATKTEGELRRTAQLLGALWQEIPGTVCGTV